MAIKAKESEIGARMMARRKELGIKRPELAKMLDVKPNTIYRYETGAIGMNDTLKVQIANILGVSLAYLVLGETDRNDSDVPEPVIPPQLSLPVIEQEACSDTGFDWSNIKAKAKTWMPWPSQEAGGPVSPDKPYFVRAEGKSMTGADIDDGCLVLVNPNVEVISGDIAYVKWNGRCSVKGIIFYPDKRIELRPANKDFSSIWIEEDEIEMLEIIGKVVRWVNIGIPNKIF